MGAIKLLPNLCDDESLVMKINDLELRECQYDSFLICVNNEKWNEFKSSGSTNYESDIFRIRSNITSGVVDIQAKLKLNGEYVNLQTIEYNINPRMMTLPPHNRIANDNNVEPNNPLIIASIMESG